MRIIIVHCVHAASPSASLREGQSPEQVLEAGDAHHYIEGAVRVRNFPDGERAADFGEKCAAGPMSFTAGGGQYG
jgi:hypothetical protein